MFRERIKGNEEELRRISEEILNKYLYIFWCNFDEIGKNRVDFKKKIVRKLRGNFFINCTHMFWKVFSKYVSKRVRNILKSL